MKKVRRGTDRAWLNMEDRTPLPMTVESAGETPQNAQNVSSELVDEDEPDLLVVEYSDADVDETTRIAIADVAKDDAWITADETDLVDLGEAQ